MRNDEPLTEIGTTVRVFTRYAGDWCIAPEHWDEMDAAIGHWLSSGRTADRLLTLTTPEGSDVVLLASEIVGMSRSTRDSRRRVREWNRIAKSEAMEDGEIDGD